MLYVNPVSNLDSFRVDGVPSEAARRRGALEELDHLFAFTLLQEMRKSVPAEGLFGNSNERRTYEEMLDDALAGQMAKTGQLGLARQVEAQLKTMESRGARPGAVRIFMPLERPHAAMPLEVEGPALPLRGREEDRKAFPLIKAPMRIADN